MDRKRRNGKDRQATAEIAASSRQGQSRRRRQERKGTAGRDRIVRERKRVELQEDNEPRARRISLGAR